MILKTFFKVMYYEADAIKDGEFDSYAFKTKEFDKFPDARAFGQSHCDIAGSAIIEKTVRRKNGLAVFDTHTGDTWECTQTECYEV